jgi:hypothetical protein
VDAKKYTLIILSLTFLFLFTFASFNFFIDPLQIYRKLPDSYCVFWRNQRNQNAGKIRNYLDGIKYNSIILGNSVIDNFIPTDFLQLFDRPPLKLTLDGGHISEQSYMLKKALETGHLSKVFWGHIAANLTVKTPDKWHREQKIPYYLYTQSFLDDDKYLFSSDIIKFSFEILTGNYNKNRWKSDLNHLNYWMNEKRARAYASYKNSRKFKKTMRHFNKHRGKNFLSPVELHSKFPAVDKHIIPIVKNNPDIEFIFVFSPESRFALVARGPQNLKRYLEVQKYIVSSLSECKNIEIYGFEAVDEIVNNLFNYRDNIHYHSGVNFYILNKIAKKEHLLNINTIDDYIERIQSPLSSYYPHFNLPSMIKMRKKSEQEAFSSAIKTRGIATAISRSGN